MLLTDQPQIALEDARLARAALDQLAREHPEIEARYFQVQAETLSALGRADEALDCIQAGLAYYREHALDQPLLLAELRTTAAWCLYRRGRRDMADQQARQAQQILTVPGNRPLDEVMAWRRLVTYHLARGHQAQASELLARTQRRADAIDGLDPCLLTFP